MPLRDGRSVVNVPDLLIRADERAAEVKGDIVFGEEEVTFRIRIGRRGLIEVSGGTTTEDLLETRNIGENPGFDHLLTHICGFAPNAVVEKTFLLFHSYRKVQEGNPEMGAMIEKGSSRQYYGVRPWDRIPLSEFKMQILRSLMRRAKLFELDNEEYAEDMIESLNKLIRSYAGGTIGKLRLAADNTIDFRMIRDRGGSSFTFDGLSSGQKEMISTLFLIFCHTRNRPTVVLIDETELHINAQLHRNFVKNMINIAPQNQYIIATHSEDVMDSVSEDRRALISSSDELE